MWETRRTSQIAREMRRYNLVFRGIIETHLTQARQQRLDTREMLLYSGHGQGSAPHIQGVALMLSEEARSTHQDDSTVRSWNL